VRQPILLGKTTKFGAAKMWTLFEKFRQNQIIKTKNYFSTGEPFEQKKMLRNPDALTKEEALHFRSWPKPLKRSRYGKRAPW
jgi:hypothetical protein